jgi:hypothetical protein
VARKEREKQERGPGPNILFKGIPLIIPLTTYLPSTMFHHLPVVPQAEDKAFHTWAFGAFNTQTTADAINQS